MKHIELWAFLKIRGVVSTQGQAKELIRSGVVKVNGEEETRVRKKLVERDKVECEGETFVVKEEELRME